jgi:hypothetical protein
MEKGTKVLLGVGCGCFGLAGLVVAVAAAIMLLGVRDSGELVPYPDGVPAVTPPEVLQAVGDPRDAAFATYVSDATTAVFAAARGLPHDARWNGASPMEDLRGTSPSARTELAVLGADPQVFLTMVELEATNGTSRVRSNVAVFPDGRVRWANVRRDAIETTPTPGLSLAAPALAAEATRMLETLGGACDLPVVTATDFAALPLEAQTDAMREVAEIPQACAPGASAIGWEPKVDDVTIVLIGGGRVVGLRTQIEVQAGSVVLGAASVRVLQ